jgi:hypothetical protein
MPEAAGFGSPPFLPLKITINPDGEQSLSGFFIA